ncbi:acyl carrier protein [Natronospira bacteriovora]|uniref:Acyl carrier protein n=1 Tax=Natronospira bacteriovora TaxID=3069753 RepID=A0ABU0W4S0_9GAMM|nr:acyl carrier protein [Natronospira sp. AB-CW4]MDQ2069026.1 acyl carrier protein [Natronospira sp. AB-CW4]
MNRDALRQAILEELSDIAPDIDTAVVKDTETLREEYDLDSMDAMNLLIAIHKRLQVDIPERDYGRMQTLGELLDYLEARNR